MYADLTLAVHLALLAQIIGVSSIIDMTFRWLGIVCTRESYVCMHVHHSHTHTQNECFFELRTRQQLGYVVFCFKQTNNMIGSFQVLVQSQEYDPEHVLNSVDKFLQSYYDETIQSDNFTIMFAEQKQVLKLSLQQREPTLQERTNRLWTQITNGQLQFDYNSQLLSMLSSDSINATSMNSFYCDNILDSSIYHKLVLVVYGEGKEFEPDVNYPLEYGSLLQNITHYPNNDLFA